MAYPKMVHGRTVTTLAEELSIQIKYAKTTCLPQRSLYEVHGKITMAHELNAISTDQYLKLEHECVYEGINNPRYFDN